MNSNNIEWLRKRSNQYTLVSLFFTDPHTSKFGLLLDSEFQDQFKIDFLKGNIQKIQHAYLHLFSHSLSKPNSLYEIENLANGDVFYRTHCLADITGFYKAFGLQVNPSERADHISVECEFMSHLILKEIIAIENNLGNETIKIAHDAQVSFGGDHLFKWAIPFCNRLKEEDSLYYREVSKIAGDFFRIEQPGEPNLA